MKHSQNTCKANYSYTKEVSNIYTNTYTLTFKSKQLLHNRQHLRQHRLDNSDNVRFTRPVNGANAMFSVGY